MLVLLQSIGIALNPHKQRSFHVRPRTTRRSIPPSILAEFRPFYEVYPQSFADSNGDGIGDLRGLTERLGYIHDLGCNALWINPCFDSPFKDAGYDVRDYTKVAPRYGTNDDLTALFEHAHTLGMHVLLDLVPGHTSEEHPWFQASSRPDPTERVTPVDADRTIPVESVTPVGQTTPRIASLFDPRRRGSDCETIRRVGPGIRHPRIRLRPLHLDRLVDLPRRRPALHWRRNRARRHLHHQLLQMPARPQLRLRPPQTPMAEARTRPRSTGHLRGDARRHALLALPRGRRLPRGHGRQPRQTRRRRQAFHHPHLAIHLLENPPRIPRGSIRCRMGAPL